MLPVTDLVADSVSGSSGLTSMSADMHATCLGVHCCGTARLRAQHGVPSPLQVCQPTATAYTAPATSAPPATSTTPTPIITPWPGLSAAAGCPGTDGWCRTTAARSSWTWSGWVALRQAWLGHAVGSESGGGACSPIMRYTSSSTSSPVIDSCTETLEAAAGVLAIASCCQQLCAVS
jgi:hypothetical protein